MIVYTFVVGLWLSTTQKFLNPFLKFYILQQKKNKQPKLKQVIYFFKKADTKTFFVYYKYNFF